MARGTGETTRQLKSLPIDGIFIWCNSQIEYPKMLVKELDRPDIKIMPLRYLEDTTRFIGREFTGACVDHAARMSDLQYMGWIFLQTRVR